MPKRSSKPEREMDEAQREKDTANSNSNVHQKNPAAVALGRLGGLKGGKARAEKLSAKKRKEIARKAAVTRWKRDF